MKKFVHVEGLNFKWKDNTKINLQGIGSKSVNEVYLIRPGSSGGSCKHGSRILGP
jgi:hypothetical protein